MRVPVIIATFLSLSSLLAGQEATVFPYNGTGTNLDTLTAGPVVIGADWHLTLTPQAERGPGAWLVLLSSEQDAGLMLDLGTKFGMPLAGLSELLVAPNAFLADIAGGAHGGGGTTATLTVPVPSDPALVGLRWNAQAIVLGDLPVSTSVTRTLRLSGSSGPLPWSEQGFTFSGGGCAAGSLIQESYGGIFDGLSLVALTRDDGGTFDAVSMDVLDLYQSPYGYFSEIGVFSDLEGDICDSYYLSNTGPTALNFAGITTLYLYVSALGDGGGLEALLQTDDFVVRVPRPRPVAAGVLDPWFSSAVGGVVGTFGSSAVRAPLFADGSVQCAGADDTKDRVGIVELRPVVDGIEFHVVLEHGAPSWSYYVEMSRNGTCAEIQQFHGFTTDENGNGVFEGVYAADPGSYAILVDVVSDPPGSVPSDPALREIAPSALMGITLP